MLKKLKIPLSIGDRVYFKTPLDKPGNRVPFLELLDYSVVDGRLQWTFKSDKNQFVIGRVKDQQTIPFFEGMWVTASIPVTLHYKIKGLAIDFIFGVSGIVTVDRVEKHTITDNS